MHTANNITHLAKLFAQPAAHPGTHAPVCLIAADCKPSEWAEKCLHFKPNAKQAEVLDTEARFLHVCCNRQWGKTTTIAIKALHHALANPGQTIVIISRTKLQAGILISRAGYFTGVLGLRIRRVLGHQFSLQFPNGSSIFAVAHNGDTSVGNTATVLIVDEAALVKDNVYYSVSPSVSRTRGKIWMMSTPRRQAGFFYNIWRDESNRWHKIFSNVIDCPEIDPEFLEMQKAADPVQYSQDFLCQFVQPADRLVTREILERMIDKTIDQWHIPVSSITQQFLRDQEKQGRK